MIRLRHVDRIYPLKGGPYYALRNINFTIAEGDFPSIMDPSGSGKSPLLHILGLHDAAWAGEYTLAGSPVHQLDKKKRFELQRKHLGFVFQSYHLLDDLTVHENLEIPRSHRHVPKKDLYPAQLPGSQQQPFGIARALVAKPALILADEPTRNLHSDQGREIMELFRKLNRDDGVTIVQVTHSHENATYGTRIVRLAGGVIVSS